VWGLGVSAMTDQQDQQDQQQRPEPAHAGDDSASKAAARARIEHQAKWVDLQIQQAMARGEFDDLPGTGKPIRDLGSQHDPDWWLKKLIEREQITGVLPPALQLRKEDAELDAKLDGFVAESEVRRELEDFNARVMRARYTPVDGPPLVTQPRDVDAEVVAWRDRLAERRAVRRGRPGAPAPEPPTTRRRWWRRSSYRAE
jgi:hypothetical protein